MNESQLTTQIKNYLKSKGNRLLTIIFAVFVFIALLFVGHLVMSRVFEINLADRIKDAVIVEKKTEEKEKDNETLNEEQKDEKQEETILE